uniref:Carboxylic ester hydrolase n=1 Tax=Anopheles epiroticus TaxID=199890 RepID=A0A182PUM5_9DIPT
MMDRAGTLLLLVIVQLCTADISACLQSAEVTDEPIERSTCTVRFNDEATGAGVYNETFNGVPYCTFLGIRYAKPPVGELRFANPVLEDPTGRQNYSAYGSMCSQFKNINRQEELVGSEDCLYLNVFAPLRGDENDTRPVKYPVLVFIHGGSFIAGSGEVHGVDLLVENEIIVVTLNYRLGVLGFLRNERLNITGNYGLKDQLAALQWVKRNIHHFGGDPERVTLMGHSAGAGAVTHHLYQQQAAGLFHSLIVLSGSMLAPWALLHDHLRCQDNFVQDLSANTLADYQQLDRQDLFRADRKLRYSFAFCSMFYVCFIPTLDNRTTETDAYFTRPPHETVRTQAPPQMPILISETASEFLFLLPHIFDFWMSSNYPNQHQPAIRRQVSEILDNVSNWAVAQGLEPTKQRFYQQMANMANLYYPIRRLLREIGKRLHGDQLYYLRFEFDGKFGEYKKKVYARYVETDEYGALHGDELGYIFSPYNLREAVENRTAYRKELSVHKRTVELLANFVKYGNPTPKRSKLSDVVWPPYSEANNRTQYLNIDEEFTLHSVDNGRNLYYQLWEIVYECLYYSHCEAISLLEQLADQYGGTIVDNENDIDILDEEMKSNLA